VIDVRAWGIWAVAVLVIASTCRNPFYAIVVFLIITITDAAVRGEQERGVPSPLRFAAMAIPLSAILNALVSPVGQTALFRLPDWLPLIGGSITLEALVYGGTNGLLLTLIFGAFSLFSRAVPTREMIRLVPRALSEGGMVMSIALTFVPQTSRAIRRVREAQALRGHRVKGVRDWLPIVVPLLVSGLERSMNLAEAMVSRGYGAVSARSAPSVLRATLVLGLLALLGGWTGLTFSAEKAWPAIALAMGGVIIIGTVWRMGRSHVTTRYHESRWTRRDTAVVIGVCLALTSMVFRLPFIERESLSYAPYPYLSWPPFDPVIGITLLGLSMPALVLLREPAE